MRKVSKSRVDDTDDVVSSTNGSVLNDDQPESNKQVDEDEEDKIQDSEDNAKDDEDYDGSLNASKSKSKGKGRPKKKGRKSKNADSEDDDADEKSKESENDASNDEDYDESTKSKTKSKGRPKKKGAKKSSKAEKNADDNDEPEEEYEVDKIIDSKKIKGRLHYLIRWKGYSSDSDSWEPENTLSCPELINKFNEEKENSKDKEEGGKRGRKRKAGKKESKSSPKKAKEEWDSENADENAEYEVDKILEVHHKKNGKREFLIHWKGWSTKFDSWEPENHLNCPDLIKKFMEKVNVAKSSDSRNLRVAREATNRFTLQDPSSGRRLSKRRGQRQRVRYDDAE